MAEPLFRDNLKIHFAGAEGMDHAAALHHAGVKYSLFSCYSFVLSRLKAKGKAKKKVSDGKVPTYLQEWGEHVIMDSGLFTLMFGSAKGKKDESFLHKWMLELVAFVRETGFKGTCVEVDCQKILSPEVAWKFRRELKTLLPNNRIINVFHLEDGKEGLDRLIEFSDYIAISVPELRIHKSKTYRADVRALARYIKSKKSKIDIHLLGCTQSDMLRENNFCTSADSTSWLASVRWAVIPFVLKGKKIVNHVSQFNEKILLKRYSDKVDKVIKIATTREGPRTRANIARNLLAAEMHLHEYEFLLGNQK